MFNLIVGFVNDVIVVSGTAITTAMLATQEVALPAGAVWLVALLMGLVQAARRLDSKLAPSPVKPEAVLVRSPEQLQAQVKVTEDTLEHVIERVTQAMKAPATVTPKRVEVVPPEPVSPAAVLKDSS